MRHRQSAHLAGPRAQRGQAMLFILATALVMLLAMLTLFSMGQLTTEKMKLQNTADAAAYSAALAQARDYNFSAYMNRGMIANDVAVAQLVSLAAWGRNYKDTFTRLTNDVDVNYSYIQPGPLYPLWSISEGLARTPASTVESAFTTAAKVLVPALLTLNEGLVLGQNIYHFGTALTVAQTLGADSKFNNLVAGMVGFDLSVITNYLGENGSYNIVKANDEEAQLSLLGMAGFAVNTRDWFGFTAMRNPLGPAGTERPTVGMCPPGWHNHRDGDDHNSYYCRLAMTLDPRSYAENREKYKSYPGFWEGDYLYLPHQNKPVFHPTDKSDDGPQKDRMAGVVKASLDGFTQDRSKTWLLPKLIDPILVIGPRDVTPGGWFLKWLYHDGETTLSEARGPDGLRKSDSWNHRWEAVDSTRMLAIQTLPIPIPFWGFFNVPLIPLWSGGAGAPLGKDASGETSAGKDEGELSTMSALRPYRDVSDISAATAMEHHSARSPAILVEVEKKTRSWAMNDLKGTTASSGCDLDSAARNASAITTPVAPDNLKLQDGAAANCMRAMAKAEAYFSRPNNLFPRGDQKTEFGSLYSPYWQARLVPPSAADQAASWVLHGLTGVKSTSAGASADAKALLATQ